MKLLLIAALFFTFTNAHAGNMRKPASTEVWEGLSYGNFPYLAVSAKTMEKCKSMLTKQMELATTLQMTVINEPSCSEMKASTDYISYSATIYLTK